MKPNLVQSLVGGLAGTVVMSLMMRLVTPIMLGHPMDIAALIGKMMGGSLAMGLVVHLMNGVVIFPAVYALVVFRMLPGPPVLRGALWGVALWLLAEAFVMPMAGAGFFSAETGGAMAAAAALMGHLVYGVLLGLIGGAAAVATPQRATGRV